MSRTLEAYGANIEDTPREITVEWTPTGILVDQFERDIDGQLIVDATGEPSRVAKFFPHPGAGGRAWAD